MKTKVLMMLVVGMLSANIALADTFATGANQFTIDFVNISGDASSANGTYIGEDRLEGFTDPGYDYRIGTYEITNDQFAKFAANYPRWGGDDVPSNSIGWFEAAQFVNYLNTSTGHQEAYKFTEAGAYMVWESGNVGYDSSNPFRNSNAHYFMPTEDEWVKAAYWNGTSLQTYATKPGDTLHQGNGSNGGWNYKEGSDSGPDGPAEGPWDVGSGSEELNGTFDMMGNVMEWMESPYNSGDYPSGFYRGVRGGSYYGNDTDLGSSYQHGDEPAVEDDGLGFRVASVPEPCTLVLLALGGLLLHRPRA